MKCYCYLRDIYGQVGPRGQTPFELRFGEPFSRPVIPFGAEITYKPITDKDKARLHQFGIKVLSGVFVGYSLNIGGGWSGDLLVAD